jgi:hypothetical protein
LETIAVLPYIRFMKAKEKRKPRAYKIADTPYKKAMRRAKKEKKALASLIEEVVVAYSDGQYILVHS